MTVGRECQVRHLTSGVPGSSQQLGSILDPLKTFGEGLFLGLSSSVDGHFPVLQVSSHKGPKRAWRFRGALDSLFGQEKINDFRVGNRPS